MRSMSLRKCFSRTAAVLMSLVVLLYACGITAFAYGRVDTDASASLKLTFAADGAGMEGVPFRLYRVADVSETVRFSLTQSFAGAAVSLDAAESAGAWTDMAVTFSAYAEANGIAPDRSGITDSDGRIAFSELQTGLYLLAGDTAVAGEHSYAPAPAVILLPSLMEDDSWNYEPDVEVKYVKSFLTEYQDITVKKAWDDDGRPERPESVEIQLLQDGTVYGTVTLDEDNGWSYTWSGLAGTYEGSAGETLAHVWSVNEAEVPEGYTVSVSREGSTYTVTNTYKTEDDRPDPGPSDPGKPDPGPSDSGSPDSETPDPVTAGQTPAGTAPIIPGAESIVPADTLPQTGALNWPVPVLAVSGLLLAGLGWYLLNRKKEN